MSSTRTNLHYIEVFKWVEKLIYNLVSAMGWLPLIDIHYIPSQLCVLASISSAPSVSPVHHVTCVRFVKNRMSIGKYRIGNSLRNKLPSHTFERKTKLFCTQTQVSL